jgi:uncharacterized protein YdeI (YjbR/CyaY-like superfamily)
MRWKNCDHPNFWLFQKGPVNQRKSKMPSGLKRQRYPMPDFIKAALVEQNLLQAYLSRPAYQQNDYIGWITRARRAETRHKRLAQMLDELTSGDLYMKMQYSVKSGKNG